MDTPNRQNPAITVIEHEQIGIDGTASRDNLGHTGLEIPRPQIATDHHRRRHAHIIVQNQYVHPGPRQNLCIGNAHVPQTIEQSMGEFRTLDQVQQP